MENIKSGIFGDTVLLKPENDDFAKLDFLISKYPVNSFGILNKLLNNNGYICSIMPFGGVNDEGN